MGPVYSVQMFEVGMNNFRLFREAIHSPSGDSPTSTTEVQNFMSFLSLNGKAPATINSYVCAVSHWHKVKGLDGPCASYLVRKTVRGAARSVGPPNTRLPITPELLRKLIVALPSVCSSTYEAKMFTCVFSLAFFGLFRIGELVCQSTKIANNAALQFDDFVFKDDLMKITIRFSKTDQFGKSTDILLKGKSDVF